MGEVKMVSKINSYEYHRLFEKNIANPVSWNIRNNLCVNSFINDIFDENMFIWRMVFDNEYDVLKNENHPKNRLDANKCIGKLELSDFDHDYGVSFKKGISQIDAPEIITGIMNFPYKSWNWISDFISRVPDGWEVFIINPILMRYAEGSIGLFLTPSYCKNAYIDECNGFIQSRTGYELFFRYSDEENVPEIHFNKPDLSLENYVRFMKKCGKNKGLSKLLDFWADNDCINVDSFESSFRDYQDNLPHLIWHDINFKEIKSTVPFNLVHKETGELLGPFYKFSLDKSFKLADTDNGVLELSQKQVDDLIEGKYDFDLIQ